MFLTRRQVNKIYLCKNNKQINCSKKLIYLLYEVCDKKIHVNKDYESRIEEEIKELLILLFEEDYLMAQYIVDYLDDMKNYFFERRD